MASAASLETLPSRRRAPVRAVSRWLSKGPAKPRFAVTTTKMARFPCLICPPRPANTRSPLSSATSTSRAVLMSPKLQVYVRSFLHYTCYIIYSFPHTFSYYVFGELYMSRSIFYTLCDLKICFIRENKNKHYDIIIKRCDAHGLILNNHRGFRAKGISLNAASRRRSQEEPDLRGFLQRGAVAGQGVRR